MSGLDITFDEFRRIKNVNQKLDILYHNQQKMRTLAMGYEKVKKQTTWQWMVISTLIAVSSWVFVQFFNHIGGIK